MANEDKIWGTSGTGVGPHMTVVNKVSSSLTQPSMYLKCSRFDSFPGFCIDTTAENMAVNVPHFETDKSWILTRGHGEGSTDLRTTQWDGIAQGNYRTSYASVGAYEFIRKEVIAGFHASFVYTNKLKKATIREPQTNLFVSDVTFNSNNQGNIIPSLNVLGTSGMTDKLYNLTINRDGYIERTSFIDSTDYNFITAPNSGTAANIGSINQKLLFGLGNLAHFVVNDGTFTLGRDNTFRFLDNIKLSYDTTEIPVVSEIFAAERDSTSFYIFETVENPISSRFLIYSRIYNPYNKTLSSRSSILQNQIYYNNYKKFGDGVIIEQEAKTSEFFPHASFVNLNGKQVLAVTLNETLTFSAIRQFFETHDGGLTWKIEDINSRNLGYESGGSNSFLTHTFGIPNNKDIFLNFTGSNNVNVFGYTHLASNFSRKPSTFMDYRNFSRLDKDVFSNQIFAFFGGFDNIQQKIALSTYYENGYIEIVKSPRFPNNSLKYFDVGADQSLQLTYNFAPRAPWKSEYIFKPFGSGSVQRNLFAYDKNGDFISICSLDATTFSISRTNFSKDDINPMGGFMLSIDGGLERYATNMFADNQGDLIYTSASQKDSSNIVYLSIAKYGQYSNIPIQLNLDRGFLYPEKPKLNVTGGSGSVNIPDSTTNGWLFTSQGVWGFPSIGTTAATTTKYLKKIKGLGGFKSTWRSFLETTYTDITSKTQTMNFNTYGNMTDSGHINGYGLVIGWDITSVWAYNSFEAGAYRIQKSLIDPKKFRHYMLVLSPTNDSSVHGILYAENLTLSNFDTIIWDKKLDWIDKQTSIAVPSSSVPDYQFIQGPPSSPDSLHMDYWYISRDQSPIQPEMSDRLGFLDEGIFSNDYTSFKDLPGIPISLAYQNRILDGLQVTWSGIDGFYGDSWKFSIDSHSNPSRLIDKQIFKPWRSFSDSTESMIYFDATNQDSDFIFANQVFFNGVNFRKCYLEAHTAPIISSGDMVSFFKEIYFDIDTGVLPQDIHSNGITTVVPCYGKHWRIGEHQGRYFQLELSNIDSTLYRHIAFEILENSEDGLKIKVGNHSLDSTAGMRFVIYDSNQALKIDYSKYAYWRIRIPQNRNNIASGIGDETQQSSVLDNQFREITEFDLGRLIQLDENIDQSSTTDNESDVKIIEFENKSTQAFEIAKPHKVRHISFTYDSSESITNLKNMFNYLQGSNYPFWLLENNEPTTRNFMLGRITNEPSFEENIFNRGSVSIDIEEIK